MTNESEYLQYAIQELRKDSFTGHNGDKCEIELSRQCIGENEYEYAVRTYCIRNRRDNVVRVMEGRIERVGKFTNTEERTVVAFNHEKNALIEYLYEKMVNGCPSYTNAQFQSDIRTLELDK